jgi:hypothetical protein
VQTHNSRRKLIIAGGWTAQSDGPIDIYLNPENSYDKVFEGSEIFADIQHRLNDEFSKNPWYFGIRIKVPHLLLGHRHQEALRQQAEDNEEYRRTWLRGRRKKRTD